MTPDVTVEPAESIPDGSCICHYDELEQQAKEQFPRLTDTNDARVSDPIADDLRRCDVIKYTRYYTVTLG